MTIIRKSRADDAERLFDVWDSSVKATHDFLSEADYQEIAEIVRTKFFPNIVCDVAVDENDRAMGFMAMTDNCVNAIFVHGDFLGRGIGSMLLDLAKSRFDTLTLDVNEQNPAAVGFYKSKGFNVVRRSEVDDHGRPYPLLFMRYEKGE